MIDALVRRARAAPSVIQAMGIGWAVFRLRYAIEIQAGLLERRSPQIPWSAIEPAGPGPDLSDVVATDALQRHLRSTLDEPGLAALRHHHERLRAFAFEVFGTTVSPASWHEDPTAGVTYPSDVHWSRVPEHAEADLKFVWEPSRFGWAFDLVRLHLVAPSSGAADTFWELFESWCDQNPPNSGVHWNCGQETSIRLIAVTCAASAMEETITPERQRLLAAFGTASGRRVAANLAYAKSQHNNHYSSEAAGLLTAATLYAQGPLRAEWLDAALDAFTHVDSELIFDDGGSSQYSMNYHRAFLHALCWAVHLCDRADIVHAPLRSAASRAAAFLAALIEPTTGFGPRYGHDDGANILPLDHAAHHRDLRPTASLCASLDLLDDVRPGDDEAGAWFASPGGPDRRASGDAVPTNDRSADFATTGLSVLRRGKTTVYLRATDYRFRPGHCDQLSLEVWHDGRCIIEDPGTLSYKTAGAEGSSSLQHSTVCIDDGEHMARVGRFLWTDWTAASAHVDPSSSSLRANHRLHRQQADHRRLVQIDDDGCVVVSDVVNSDVPTTATIRWCLGPDVTTRGTPEPALEHIEVGESYGQPTQRSVAVCSSPEGTRHRFETRISSAATVSVSTLD